MSELTQAPQIGPRTMSALDAAVGRVLDPELFTADATGRTVLKGSRCEKCSTVTFPAQASCPKCTSGDVGPTPLPTVGTLWGFTIQRFAPKTPFLGASQGQFTPYAVGYVNLDDLVLVESRIVVDDFGSLEVGLELELVSEAFHDDDDGPVLTYAFAPTGAASQGATQ